MEKLKLSHRLQAIADFVPAGSRVADIGTDHGYIPVWLAQNNLATSLVAADINIGPLQHAKQTAALYHVDDRIRFELCSGLSFEDSCEYNTVIVAGMGGELIASILEAAPWTKKENVTLILQPNSRIQVLVEWLIDSGYAIHNTKLVKDAGKLYQILIVKAGKCAPIPNEAERLVHAMYFHNRDPLLSEYIDSLLARYTAAEKGMLSGKTEHPDLTRTQRMIADLNQMKEKISAWQL